MSYNSFETHPNHLLLLFVDGEMISSASNYADFLYSMARQMTNYARQQYDLALPPLSREMLAAYPFTDFVGWLDRVEQVLDERGQSAAVLALDEFEVLDAGIDRGCFDESDVFHLLRHIIQHRPRFKLLLAGSHTLEEFNRWASYLINVQVVKMSYMREENARRLIEHPVRNFPLRYEAEASQRVFALTRGHPYLTQLLCYEIVVLKNEQPQEERRVVRASDVETAVAQALKTGYLFFADIEYNQIDPPGAELLHFLAGRGEGAIITGDRLARTAEAPDTAGQTLALLSKRDLIEEVEWGYRFQVELIRRWFARIKGDR